MAMSIKLPLPGAPFSNITRDHYLYSCVKDKEGKNLLSSKNQFCPPPLSRFDFVPFLAEKQRKNFQINISPVSYIQITSHKHFKIYINRLKIHIQIFSKKKKRKQRYGIKDDPIVSNKRSYQVSFPLERHRNFARIPNTKQLIWKLQKSDISLAELDRHPIKRPHCFETRGLKRGSVGGERSGLLRALFAGWRCEGPCSVIPYLPLSV